MLQMLQKKFIIVDIETLGLSYDAGIVEIGYLLINKMEVVDSYGNSIQPHPYSSQTPSTLEWWAEDPVRAARLDDLKASAKRKDPKEELEYMAYNWDTFNPEYIFSWHHFDCPILKETYRMFGVRPPKILEKYYMWMDASTLAGAYSLRKRPSPHRALQDCETVFELLQKIDSK